MDSEMETELEKRPFLLISLSAAIAIVLLGIHAYLIYALWDTAGWPLTSSKYLRDMIVMVAAGIVGLAIIVLSLMALRSRENANSVRMFNRILIILCLVGLIAAVAFGIFSLTYLADFPAYSSFFIGRAICLFAAAGALGFSILKAIQVSRLTKSLL